MSQAVEKEHSNGIFAWQVMMPPISTLRPEQSLVEAAKELSHHKIPAIPVIGNKGELLGIISGQQVMARVTQGMSLKEKVSGVMQHENVLILKKEQVLTLDSNIDSEIICLCRAGILEGVIYLQQLLKAYQWKTEVLSRFEDLSKEYEMILNNCYDSIYSVDGEGNVLWVNPSTERIIEKKPSQVVGRNVNDLEREQAFFPSVTSMVLQHKKPMTIIQEVSGGNKAIVTGCPVFDENHDIIRIISITRDVGKLINDIEEFTNTSALVDVYNRLKEAKNLTERYYSELRELRKERFVKKRVIACSKEMNNILELAKNVASVDSTVLILGESGVGKDVIATTIHELSDRREGPFMKINCGAIPDSLLESELFGYEAGAFTGARKERKLGLIEMAHEGTVFLDEIAELPLNLQVKILQVIQEKRFIRIGGIEPIDLNIRIISATNKDLKTMVQEGKFRSDLFYRINVVPIVIPPLRKRKQDIPQLIIHFMDRFNKKYNRNKQLCSKTIDILIDYEWPGNIRELENTIERLVVIGERDIIQPEDLPENIYQPQAQNLKTVEFIDGIEKASLKQAVETFEATIICNIYNKCKSTIKTAKILGVNQSTIVRKLKKYGINFNAE